jgi:hypothetical protein
MNALTNTFLSVPTESELNSYKIIATIAASNPYWRKLGGGGNEESVVATILSVMLLARELGISPMQAVSGGINNIQGKFELSARLMNQLLRKHGHTLKIKIMTDEVCTIWGKRRDTGEEMEVSYHIEEAKMAGLVKQGGGWMKNPQDMLFARCISRIARRLAPDCIGGCYVEGELQETMAKQIVQAPEIPAIEVIEEKIELNLPPEVDPSLAEEYIKASAKASKKFTEMDLKRRAAENITGFVDSFNVWMEKSRKTEVRVLEDAQV